MSNETIYSVKARYGVEDRASRGTGKIVSSARDLDRAATGATRSLKAMGMAVVGAFSARAAYGALVKFNSTVEDTKQQIAGMMALAKKTDLSAEIGNADRLFANLQKRAAKLPGTTQEYATMAGMLTQPIMSAGLGMKDLEDMTVNAVVASKALRVEAGAAARDVDQALRGQYHSVDVFTGKLLGSIGYAGESGREKYNALSGEKRASELKRAMMQPQIEQLAAAQGQTFSGAMSTLQDSAEQFFGKVGLPLFKQITTEIKTWNTWLDANATKVDAWARSFGSGIVDGFAMVRDSIGFLVDHASLLITVAKAWAAIKIGSTIGNVMGSLGGKGAGLIGALANMGVGASPDQWKTDPKTGDRTYEFGKQGSIKGMSGAMGALPFAGAALAGGYALGNIIGLDTIGAALGDGLAHLTGRTDAVTDAFNHVTRASETLDQAMQDAARRYGGPSASSNLLGMRDLFSQAVEAWSKGGFSSDPMVQDLITTAITKLVPTGGTIGAGENKLIADYLAGQVNTITTRQQGSSMGVIGAIAAGQQLMTDYQRQTLDEAKAQAELMTYFVQHTAKGIPVDLHEIWDILRNSTNDPTGSHKSMSDKPKVNVTIQRIEVASDDPDRFAFGLVEAFRQAAKNPSAAIAAMREG